MKAIIDKLAEFIQEWAEDQGSTLIVGNFGFCELVRRGAKGRTRNSRNFEVTSTQPIPITIPGDGSEGRQVSIDDQKNFIFWIRTNGRISVVLDDADSWGIKQGKRQNLPLRIIIAHRNNLGEDLVYNLVQDLPDRILVSGFDLVFIDSVGEIDDDHETIHNVELGETNYEKHRFTWNIYSLNINVQFVPCTDFEPDSINVDDILTDDAGNFLTAT